MRLLRWLLVSVLCLHFPILAWAAPLRLVSLAPSTTETVAGLGLADALVGVSDQCDYPPEVVKKLPKVGGMMNPSLEAILALRPGAVLVTEGNPRDLIEKLQKARIRVVEARADKAPDLAPMVRKVAQELGVAAKGNELGGKIDAALNELRKKGEARKSHPRFVVALQLDPFFSVTSETWLGGLLEMAGLRNAVPAGAVRYPQLSPEFLVKSHPDFVFADPDVAGKNATKASEDVTAFLSRVYGRKANLPRVVVFPADVMVRPGPRLLEAVNFLLSFPQ